VRNTGLVTWFSHDAFVCWISCIVFNPDAKFIDLIQAYDRFRRNTPRRVEVPYGAERGGEKHACSSSGIQGEFLGDYLDC